MTEHYSGHDFQNSIAYEIHSRFRDGMADYPILNWKPNTLAGSQKPNMDFMAANGNRSAAHTIASRQRCANLRFWGMNRKILYRTFSVEAASISVPMTANDITFRTNLVTLSGQTLMKNGSC